MQDITKTARQIAGSPEAHLDEIHLFTSAWAAMKAARGQGFNPARLRGFAGEAMKVLLLRVTKASSKVPE